MRDHLRRSEQRDGSGDARGAAALIDEIFGDRADATAAPISPGASAISARLGDATRDLTKRTNAESAAAWWFREDGGATLVAFHGPENARPVETLDPDTFEMLRRLPRARDLLNEDLRLPVPSGETRSGLSAAVALGRTSSDPNEPAPALLTLGHAPTETEVRPRTLAILEEVAHQVHSPLPSKSQWGPAEDLNEELRWLDRRAALGEMLGEVVHEVRNPILSVKTFLQLLPDHLEDPDFLTSFRGVVIEEVSRLERLLDSVLQHGRPARVGGSTEFARVEDCLQGIVDLLGHRAKKNEIDLSYEFAPELGEARISPDALRQVLLNLVLNALAITPIGGRVALSAHATKFEKGNWIVVRVDDDGPGIPKPERQRLFKAFHSTREDSPGGLGLAITRRLVEEVGGQIEVEEAPGGGARLAFRVPSRD